MRRTSLLAAGLLAVGLPAQQPLTPAEVEATARALIAAYVPAEDDADNTLQLLLDTAWRVRRHEFGSTLLAATESLWPLARRIERSALARFLGDDCCGEVVHQARFIRTVVHRLRGTRDDDPATFTGYATRVLAIGPFGDNGDFYTGVPFPPESAFPRKGATLPGRYGKVSPRLVSRSRGAYFLSLQNPATPAERGCYYGLHQVTRPTATPCYIRLWCAGSFELFLNGERLRTVDRALDDPASPVLVPAVLRAGNNHVLVKTTDNRLASFGLSYVGTDGHWLPITEPAEPFVLQPLRADGAAGATPPPPRTSPAAELMARSATAAPELRSLLRLAAVTASGSARQYLRRLDPVWRAPPQDPVLRLALATALRRATLLPEAIRRNAARQIEAAVLPGLPNHHTARMRQIRFLLDEDKREDAIQLLRGWVATGAGPAVYQRLSSLYRGLGMNAARRQLDVQWLAAHPQDLRPCLAAARHHRSVGNTASALAMLRRAARRHFGNPAVTASLISVLADLSRGDQARRILAQVHADDQRAGLRARATLCRRLGETERRLAILGTLTRHPHATVDDLRRAAREFRRAGEAARADRIEREILRRRPDAHDVRRRRTLLADGAAYPNIRRFRRSAEAAIATFRPTTREAGAAASLLIDQMIVEVFEDGSHVSEVHTLHRLNDQAGIERHKTARNAAEADEVVTLRTIATDGRSYVPNRVDGTFSMPRLTPGAIIEQRYRTFHPAAAPNPWRITKFYFQNAASPFLLSELVLIVPPGHPELVRRRKLAPPREVGLPNGKLAWIFTVENSPRLPTDPSPPPIEDIVPMLAAGYDGTIDSEARGFRRHAHARTTLTPMLERQAAALVAGKTTDLEKVQAIHAFVQETIATGRGSAEPTAILMLRKGPRFFLMLALLRAADVPFRHALAAEAHPTLRSGGTPFYAEEVPYRIPCARVEPRGAAPLWLFVDTPRHFPLGQIPSERVGAEVLLADPSQATKLPDGDWQSTSGIQTTGSLRLDAQGAATLELELTLRGGLGYGYAENVREQPRDMQDRIARSLIARMLPGWSFVRAATVDVDRPGPLKVRGTLRRPAGVQRAGDKFLLPLPLPPSGLLQTYGGRGDRTLPMRLDTRVRLDWQIDVDPGPAFRLAALPEATTKQAAHLDYALQFAPVDDGCRITRTVTQRAGQIPAEDFGAWRSLLSQLDRAEATNLELEKQPPR